MDGVAETQLRLGPSLRFRDIASLSAKLFAGKFSLNQTCLIACVSKAWACLPMKAWCHRTSEGMPLKLLGLPPQTQRSPYHKMAVSSAKWKCRRAFVIKDLSQSIRQSIMGDVTVAEDNGKETNSVYDNQYSVFNP